MTDATGSEEATSDTGTATDASDKGVAVVTGATRGIGREFARLFAGTGHDVVLVARTEADLAEAAAHLGDRFGVGTATVAADLTEPDAAGRVHEAAADAGTVTALVNNAGFGAAGRLDETDRETLLDVVDLKARAVTDLTRRFLPALRSGPRDGRLLTVASASAFVPGPRNAVYHAVNSYGLALSESLAAELDDDVTVTCLCPGPVDTDFHERAGTDSRQGGLIPTPELDPRSVARAGFRGLRRGETVVVPGLTMRAVVALARVMPRALTRRVMRYYNRGL